MKKLLQKLMEVNEWEMQLHLSELTRNELCYFLEYIQLYLSNIAGTEGYGKYQAVRSYWIIAKSVILEIKKRGK